MSYSHLSEQERYQIAIYHQQGFSPSWIAGELQRDPTTIRRELCRNRAADGRYEAATAQQQADERQSRRSRCRWKLSERMQERIITQLKWGYSPDVIAGRSRKEGVMMLSTEAIYQWIYREPELGLHRYLLSKRKRRKKRGRRSDGRGQIPDRVMISERPESVERRSESGDWEGDSIAGKKNQSRLLSLLERRSRYVRLLRPCDGTADQTAATIITGLKREEFSSLTVDNGKEFAEHRRIASSLKGVVYFAEPYSPWQRGSNENVNRMVRRYFPKGTDFRQVCLSEIRRVEYLLNNRPRKLLGYATAWEVYSAREKPPP